jgi:hypothetical protein
MVAAVVFVDDPPSLLARLAVILYSASGRSRRPLITNRPQRNRPRLDAIQIGHLTDLNLLTSSR